MMAANRPRQMAAIETNSLLRFGLALLATGALAFVSLLAYNHGLEDTLPLVLYFICWLTVPLGLLLCVAGIAYSLYRSRESTHH